MDCLVFTSIDIMAMGCKLNIKMHLTTQQIQGSATIGQRESLSAQDVYKVRAKYSDDLCTDQFQHGALLIHVQDGRNLPVGLTSDLWLRTKKGT